MLWLCRKLQRTVYWLCLLLGGLLSISVFFFTALELFPGLSNRMKLSVMKYYALRGNYLPHPTLVLVPRWVGAVVKYSYESKGDLYSSIYGVDVPATRFEGSFTAEGFRPNGSQPPVDILVLGDSYVEIGETDQDTFSERLSAASGLSTFNLGRGWYGPYQYLELFKTYGIKTKPRYVLLCFFAGNDIQDILEYEKWKHGKGYYYVDLTQLNILQRYIIVMSEVRDILLKLEQYLIDSGRPKQESHPDLGRVDELFDHQPRRHEMNKSQIGLAEFLIPRGNAAKLFEAVEEPFHLLA